MSCLSLFGMLAVRLSYIEVLKVQSFKKGQVVVWHDIKYKTMAIYTGIRTYAYMNLHANL